MGSCYVVVERCEEVSYKYNILLRSQLPIFIYIYICIYIYIYVYIYIYIY